jgi:hypothetical protein
MWVVGGARMWLGCCLVCWCVVVCGVVWACKVDVHVRYGRCSEVVTWQIMGVGCMYGECGGGGWRGQGL